MDDCLQERVDQTYSKTENKIDQLLMEILTVEQLIAETLASPYDSPEQLKAKMNRLKELNERLAAAKSPVNVCLNEADQISTEGAELLSPEEFHNLRRHRDELKKRFAAAEIGSASVIERMENVLQLRRQFDAESNQFSMWIRRSVDSLKLLQSDIGNVAQINGNQQRAKAINDDVKSGGNELKAVANLGHRVQEEIRNASQELSSMRVRPGRQSSIDLKDSEVRDFVNELTADYQSLSKRSDDLLALSHTVGKGNQDFQSALTTAENWLTSVERRAAQMPISPDGVQMRKKLADVKDLHAELAAQPNLVDRVKFAGDQLTSAMVGTETYEAEKRAVDEVVSEMNNRLNSVRQKLTEEGNTVQGTLFIYEGVLIGIENLTSWLDETEYTCNQLLPLNKDKLAEQARAQRLMVADVDSHRQTVELLKAEVEKLLESNARSQPIKKKMAMIVDRLAHFSIRCAKWGDSLVGCEALLDQFNRESLQYDEWLTQNLAALSSRDLTKLELVEFEAQVGKLIGDVKSDEGKLDRLRQLGNKLFWLPHVDDIGPVREKLRHFDERWTNLKDLVKERQQQLSDRKQKINAFDAQLLKVVEWLSATEHNVDQLIPVALDRDLANTQLSEIKDLAEEHKLFKPEMDNLSRMGNAYISLMQVHQPDSKRARRDRDGEGPSRPPPAVLSPQSTPSSGFSSFDNMAVMEEMSAVHQQMFDCNQRYELLGARLNDRKSELDGMTDRLQKVETECDRLRDFADSRQQQIDISNLPLSKEESAKLLAEINGTLGSLKKLFSSKVLQTPNIGSIDVIKRQLNKLNKFKTDLEPMGRKIADLLQRGIFSDESVGLGRDKSKLNSAVDKLETTSNELISRVSDCLSALEQALPLSEHLAEAMEEMNGWLSFAENELENAPSVTPSLQPDQIRRQQENNKGLLQSLQENKSLLDRINKTGGALASLCNDEGPTHIHDSTNHLNRRFEAIRDNVRSRAQALDDALQQTSQFSDKLDGMLQALSNTASQVKNAEPIAAHPEKIRDQIRDNLAVVEEMQQRSNAYQNVKTDAADIISKADPNDPAVQEIEQKISHLDMLWNEISTGTSLRGQALNETLAVAEKFWEELNGCAAALSDLEKRLDAATIPGVGTSEIQAQQDQLGHIEASLHEQTPLVKNVKQTAAELLDLVGEAEKPEVLHRVNELDCVIETVTQAFFRRQNDLLEAMDEAMIYHELMGDIQEWLGSAEEEVAHFPPVSSSLLEIQEQIEELGRFKDGLGQRMIDVELLNQQAAKLVEGTAPEQAMVVKKPLAEVNKRWKVLGHKLSDRQKRLERALLQMGLIQLVDWINEKDQTLIDIRPMPKNIEQIEIALAKHRMLQNDVHSHQSSVDTINDTGRKLVEAHVENSEATQAKIKNLQRLWRQLLDKLGAKQAELDSAKTDAESFSGLVQDCLMWLAEVDSALLSSKPVGGLPEIVYEELCKFYEMREDWPKVENVVQLGEDYIAKSAENEASALGHSVKNLRQKWLAAQTKAADRRITLEIALIDAEEFQELLEKMKHFDFDVWLGRYVDWMQHKESRVMDFFRRQDKDGDGKVTREEFIEGILQSKFPTNRLEMNAVADRFYKDRDGYIDYKEFINAPRPDRETTQPATDAEKIKSEVVRQLQMCMCQKTGHQPFKVKEVDEGKYRVGDSIRLVRFIPPSTVMVRVGGGWIALDEFLVKNDPCRAKDRTNMELREKFILPEGASQTMQAFKVRSSPKPGSSQASSGGSGSTKASPSFATPGPIMKIREKTERSLPLSRTLRTTPAHNHSAHSHPHPPHSHGTPVSPADSEVSSILSDSRRSSGGLLSPDGRPASRRSIRGGLTGPTGSLRTPSSAAESADIPKLPSRPPSRAGSDISDISIRSRDSLGGAAIGATPTRIPSIRGRKSVAGGESSAKPQPR